MADVLRLQAEDDRPATPGEEKVSRLSYLQCHRSAVSVALCAVFPRR